MTVIETKCMRCKSCEVMLLMIALVIIGVWDSPN